MKQEQSSKPQQFDERMLEASAKHLSIDPQRITSVQASTDGGGHFTGIEVVIHISTGRRLGKWVDDKLLS